MRSKQVAIGDPQIGKIDSEYIARPLPRRLSTGATPTVTYRLRRRRPPASAHRLIRFGRIVIDASCA